MHNIGYFFFATFVYALMMAVAVILPATVVIYLVWSVMGIFV